MGKAKRKPRPSMPDWFWWGQDGCWFCKQRNNCNQCKANREYVKEFGEKKQKGRHASAKRGARTKLQLMEDDYGFDEVLGRKAYVVYLEVGERGFIKYLPDYDDRYHCLHTSTVLDFTPWENGEDTITIQTANTEYILTKQ